LSIQTRLIDYVDGDTVFEGLMAWDGRTAGPRPGIMIAHTIAGRSDFEEDRAHQLAQLGYVGFAIDVYGKGTQGSDLDKNRAWMTSLGEDRPLLQRRLLSALSAMRAQPEVDAANVAAIGFCFGGLCALDVARVGADVAGVASFHGILSAPGNTAGNRIGAKVLVLHGWGDPLAKPEEVVSLADELTSMGADWQMHAYGNTMHAFTNPSASDPDSGKQYSEIVNRRSWIAMQNFFAELFGEQGE
jgi:dienelactone hydrolase